MQDKPVALITGSNHESVFRSPRIGRRTASPCSSDRATSSMGGGPRRPSRAIRESSSSTSPIRSSIDAAAERTRPELGRLDVLVNNAGIMNAGRPADRLEEQLNAGRLSAVALDEVRTVFDTNPFGVIAVTKALLPLLREASAPRIVNIDQIYLWKWEPGTAEQTSAGRMAAGAPPS